MKKLLFIVVILFATLSLTAQTYYKTTDRLNINYGNGFTGWNYCAVDIKIDTDNDQIIIYSDNIQVFHVNTSETSYGTNYKLVRCWCSDYDKVNCVMNIYFYNSSNWYIKLIYSNIEYKYRIKY